MPTIRVDGYWSAEKCNIEPCARESFGDPRYYVFVRPVSSNLEGRTECVGLVSREVLAELIFSDPNDTK